MHSLWIGESILQTALEQADECHGKRIKVISVKIQEENFVESDWLQFCLEVAAMGTIAEGARIEIELATSTTCDDGTLATSTGRELFEVAVEVD